MGGQVLGGGVIVAVAVALWLVYLLPSWASRYQYTSSERNAVRLNQALRVLAETSETPREVRLELNARTALAQQRLARRAQAEREQADLAVARAALEAAKEESATERELARAAQAEAVAAARAERAAVRERPALRRARARRRMRLTTTVLAIAALAATGVGAWQFLSAATSVLLWAGGGTFLLCAVVLIRMSRVASRGAVRERPVAATERVAPAMPDLAVGRPRSAAWTPRELPKPLASSSGSRAAAVLDAQEAREALRVAAREEAIRDLAQQNQPPSIDEARVARASEFTRMGYVDDAEIEAHVRDLLTRRAVGQ